MDKRISHTKTVLCSLLKGHAKRQREMQRPEVGGEGKRWVAKATIISS
jgi:hypothetical protein